MGPLVFSGSWALELDCMARLSKVSSYSSSESADIETSEAESSFSIIEIIWLLDDPASGLTFEIVGLGDVAVDVSVVEIPVLPEGISLPGVSILNQG